MNEEISSYLANIEEYVFDEKKIVTCSWLSKTLGIHANLSKQLLYTFYDQSPKKDELSLTFLIIGSPDDDGRCQVSIVKDKDLEECESNWKIVTSKHIYSIQRCSDLTDLNVLYTAQKAETTDTLSKGISAIDFNCNERDNSLIAKLRADALPVPSKQPLGAVKKTVPQPTAKTKSPVKKQEKNSEEDNAETSKDKGSVIPSIFKNSKRTENKTSKPAEKPVPKTKKPQGIGAFFSKATKETKKQEESEKVKGEKESPGTGRHSPSKENKPTLNIVNEDKAVNKNDINDEKIKVNESPKETSPKSKKPQTKQKATAKKSTSKKGKTKKVVKEQKKRKRLVVASDSESENGSGEEEEMREPTPEPEPTPMPVDDDDDIICATPEPASKKRKKKLVSKMTKTPDGFMKTEKHWVSESGSEGEEESVPEKKFKSDTQTEVNKRQFESESVEQSERAPTKSSPVPKNCSKNKKVSPQKTKQVQLTNFFKKK